MLNLPQRVSVILINLLIVYCSFVIVYLALTLGAYILVKVAELFSYLASFVGWFMVEPEGFALVILATVGYTVLVKWPKLKEQSSQDTQSE